MQEPLRPSPTLDQLPAHLRTAIDVAVSKSARGPVVLHATQVTGYTDWVLIVSARSERQVRSITEGIIAELSHQGRKPLGTDGLDAHQWDLIDYDDFMIHVFYRPVRTLYDLESMWRDAPRVALGLPADVMDTSDLDEFLPASVLPAYRETAARLLPSSPAAARPAAGEASGHAYLGRLKAFGRISPEDAGTPARTSGSTHSTSFDASDDEGEENEDAGEDDDLYADEDAYTDEDADEDDHTYDEADDLADEEPSDSGSTAATDASSTAVDDENDEDPKAAGSKGDTGRPKA